MQTDRCKHQPHKQVCLPCPSVLCGHGNQRDREGVRDRRTKRKRAGGEMSRSQGKKTGKGRAEKGGAERIEKCCSLITLGALDAAVVDEETNGQKYQSS